MANVMNKYKQLILTLPSFVWLLVFFVVPSVLVFLIAFKSADATGGISSTWTLDTIKNVMNPSYLGIAWRTIWVSVIITIICVMLAISVGYWIATQDKKYRNLYLLLLIIPLWTNFLIRIFAWRLLLHPSGIIRNTLLKLGLISDDVMLLNNIGAVIVVSVYNFLPFAILPIYAAAEKFDFSLLEAARDLGAGKLRSFIKIFIPGIKRGIITAILVVLIPSMGSYAIPDLVGGIGGDLLGNKIASKVTLSRNLPEGSALAAFLTIIIIIPMTFLLMGKIKRHLRKLNKK